MIKTADHTLEGGGKIPSAWSDFNLEAFPPANPNRIVITFEGLEPPRDTHQSRVRIFRNRAGKVFIGKAKASAETRRFLDALTTAVLELRRTRHPGLTLLKTGPVGLRLGLFYSWPKSASKATRAKTLFRTVRPDADNLVKTIQDALTVREVVSDDSQVSYLEVRKYNSPLPGLILSIEPLIQ